ncbi:MAG: flagellar biosynthesis regulator FlaF [Bauldia sp.]|nr:flagellar biosynthesis regulator FlaF [Bauldia sp.]
MYKLSYAEIMEGDLREARAREQIAIDHGIELMKRAEAEGGNSPQMSEALQYVQRLWVFFIENLTDPDNELAAPVKGDLISIGLWAIAEADRILADPSTGFAALIDVNKAIRDGLA